MEPGKEKVEPSETNATSGPVRRWLGSFRDAVTPGPVVRKGFSRGALAFAAVIALMAGSFLRPGVGPVADPLIGMGAGLVLVALLGVAVLLLLKLFAVLPRFLPWPVIGALGAIGVLFVILPITSTLAPLYAVAVVLLQAFFGGALLLVLRSGVRGLHPFKRTVAILFIAIGAVLNVYLVVWLAYPGSKRHLVEAREDRPVAVLDAPNPTEPGPYAVNTLFYGSGTDLRRPEFGADVDIVTPTVDASPYTDTGKRRKKLRTWYWGFDRDAFPLNGRVWQPEGEGPFPLVLIVHGNHMMEDHSDPGYEWIAAHLASRGFIAVSVDQNFLNISWHGNWKQENDCRAWILLKHLELWREWNQTAENPFHGRVDMDRIALIGHSRGGEAAAIAAAFNKLEHYPDDARETFDFNFGIRSVIAIAPSEGQYKPANQGVPLENINYFVLSGGHDADVAIYMGKRQYNRVRFRGDGDWFKSSLYIYRANHGQFNTRWGRADFPFPVSRLLNLRPLLEGEEQRQIGTVYFTAFLETTLRDRDEYRSLFMDHRAALDWLPGDMYLTRYEDSRFEALCRYDEDIDLNSTTLPGGRIEGEGLAVWREEHQKFRGHHGTKENAVAVVGWNQQDNGLPPSYSIHLPDVWSGGSIVPGSSLAFALAESRETAPLHDDDENGKGYAERDSLDLTVELIDANGNTARRPLSDFRTVQPPLVSRFTKLWSEKFGYGDGWEATLQTFLLPLNEFSASSDFDPRQLKTIRYLFDRTSEGVILLDDIGIQGAP